MKQTVTITIFHLLNNIWVKETRTGCMWEEDLRANIIKTGLSNADSLYVSVPWSDEPLVITKGKDLVIKGAISGEIDNTSSTTISASLKALRASHEVFTINSCAVKNHGSRRMWHYELSGK